MEGGERVCLSCIRRDIICNVNLYALAQAFIVLYKIKREKCKKNCHEHKRVSGKTFFDARLGKKHFFSAYKRSFNLWE